MKTMSISLRAFVPVVAAADDLVILNSHEPSKATMSRASVLNHWMLKGAQSDGVDLTIYGGDSDPVTAALKKALAAGVKMTARDREMMTWRLTHTAEQTGEKFGVTKQRVAQIQEKVLKAGAVG